MRTENAKVRVGALASRQSGRIARWQLGRLDVANAVIARWIGDGYLRRTLPGVFAVGHAAPHVEADLAAALLYAGPNAMLSHGTAAWWYGLIDNRPTTTQLSTPRRCRSLPRIKVHARRDLERAWHKRLPITTAAQTALDFAASASLNRVRVLLANAEYRQLLDVQAASALLGPGRPGSTKLRKALARHEPRLAHTASPYEVTMFTICERFKLPLPEPNAWIAGWKVDFYWPEHGVVVEVDPHGNHHTPAQVDRDRRKDLALRARNLAVNRYSGDQVEQTAEAVGTDLATTLEKRAA